MGGERNANLSHESFDETGFASADEARQHFRGMLERAQERTRSEFYRLKAQQMDNDPDFFARGKNRPQSQRRKRVLSPVNELAEGLSLDSLAASGR